MSPSQENLFMQLNLVQTAICVCENKKNWIWKSRPYIRLLLQRASTHSELRTALGSPMEAAEGSGTMKVGARGGGGGVMKVGDIGSTAFPPTFLEARDPK